MNMKKKSIVVLLLGLIYGCLAFGQNEHTKTSIHDAIKIHSDAVFDSLVKIRRDFHMYPEVSGQEQVTSAKIEKYLRALGLEVKTNIGGYGVIGILHTNNEGRKIAWRADIDALQSDLPDKVAFASKYTGVRHICGHDVHTTIGLGIANVLAHNKDNLNGTVYFLFQPSEENFKGAKAMIDDGLFKIIKPDEIYGIHMFPMPTGIISTKAEEVFAYNRTIRLTFEKDIPIDSVKQMTKEIAHELFRVKPESKPWELQHLSHPEKGLGNPNTIFRDYLFMYEDFTITEQEDRVLFESTLFETNKAGLEKILTKTRQHVSASKYSDKLVSVEYVTEAPTVVNDKKLAEGALETIGEIYGHQNVHPDYGQIPFFNDDFAYFQHHVPGVYFFLGGSDYEKGLISMPHSPDFAVDEESIKVGVKYFSSLIVERTKPE